MTFKYGKLRGRIVEKYGSLRAFANELGMSNVLLSAKMNNKVRFTSDDIIKCVNLLNIDANEIGTYFFTQKV